MRLAAVYGPRIKRLSTALKGLGARAAQLILKIYKETTRLKEMGINGYKYAVKNFSKKECMDQLESLLRT